MKTTYRIPETRVSYIQLQTFMNPPSVQSDNGIKDGGEDKGGDYDPDAKKRGGIDGWGDLW